MSEKPISRMTKAELAIELRSARARASQYERLYRSEKNRERIEESCKASAVADKEKLDEFYQLGGMRRMLWSIEQSAPVVSLALENKAPEA